MPDSTAPAAPDPALDPAPAETASDLLDTALAHHQRGELAEAGRLYQQLLARQPGHAQALHLLGMTRLQQDDPAGAATHFGHALICQPDHADSHLYLGVALRRLGRLDAALASYSRALQLRPDHADTLYNRSNLLLEAGWPEAALAGYDHALQLRPDHADSLSNRAQTLRRLGRTAEALQDLDRSLALRPGHQRTRMLRSSVLLELGRPADALADCDVLLQAQPDDAEAAVNRAHALLLLGRHADTQDAYDAVLARRPDHFGAAFNRSMCLLLQGRFEAGWPAYEERWNDPALVPLRSPASTPVPLWRGEPEQLAGRTILLYAEQGLGDTLQFCRYVPLVKALGARVVLEVQPALRSLLAGLPGVDALHSPGEELPPFDLQCPLLSLPLAFGTRLDTIPAAPPPGRYLQAPPERLAAWRQRLGPAPRPRIGLVWSGNPQHGNDHHRSLPLTTLLLHLQPLLADIDCHVLQKDIRPADQPLLDAAPQIQRWSAELHDFTDTAALCELMDLVISVDTSVAHLAGALGRPLWLLLPFAPDWRWLLERSDSPWYPSARLWRQRRTGDWDGLLAQIIPALRAQLRWLAPK